jgi:hypothetical protein
LAWFYINHCDAATDSLNGSINTRNTAESLTTALDLNFFSSLLFFIYHPSLFTICTSTFSKLVEGSWWVSWRRALISTLL